MAAWDPPSDAVLAAGKPGKPSQARRIRDLSTALAERASGAPWVNGVGAVEYLALFGLLPGGSADLAGTWIVPDNVSRILVTLVGGGGAGGLGELYEVGGPWLRQGGGGGGAGAVRSAILSVSSGQVMTVKLGAGGDPVQKDPSVDSSLDGFELGDGARTAFGALVALGGLHGVAGSAGGAGGAGGAAGSGGAHLEDQVTTTGAKGAQAVHPNPSSALALRPGQGGQSIFGSGGSGRTSIGTGITTLAPGSGGGGGHPATGTSPSSNRGGDGANGIVIVRY